LDRSMSSSTPDPSQNPNHRSDLSSLRRKMTDELCSFVLDDRHKAIDFVYQACPRIPLHILEDIVNALDEMYQDEGPSGVGYIYGD
jgi:hypothetical protein